MLDQLVRLIKYLETAKILKFKLQYHCMSQYCNLSKCNLDYNWLVMRGMILRLETRVDGL